MLNLAAVLLRKHGFDRAFEARALIQGYRDN
jgi:hypothetical protein